MLCNLLHLQLLGAARFDWTKPFNVPNLHGLEPSTALQVAASREQRSSDLVKVRCLLEGPTAAGSARMCFECHPNICFGQMLGCALLVAMPASEFAGKPSLVSS